MTLILCNGAPASATQLAMLALVNYGHFTTLQVRGGAARGLDLHLCRLERATQRLFGSTLDIAALRVQLRAGLAAFCQADASLKITVYATGFDFRDPLRPVSVDTLLAISSPSVLPTIGVRVRSVPFVRPLPDLKHVGTFPLFALRRDVLAAGFDDALLVDGDRHLLEGTFWNLGFWDGQCVTWPEGPALAGTQQALLRAGLEQLGVPQIVRPLRHADLGDFVAAFLCNARGQQPLSAIDEHLYSVSEAAMTLLECALATQPWQPL
ncbi:MAG TPA: aminotransferase class IV family protein [Xylella taiwanensis]